jgi:hypothetical protein
MNSLITWALGAGNAGRYKIGNGYISVISTHPTTRSGICLISIRGTSRRVADRDHGASEKRWAVQMANHASTRTTQLYDRRREALSLDEVERIRV